MITQIQLQSAREQIQEDILTFGEGLSDTILDGLCQIVADNFRLLIDTPAVSDNPQENWENDSIQFPRLIAELAALEAFGPKICQQLSEEMDLDQDDINDLIDRAQMQWDNIKTNTK